MTECLKIGFDSKHLAIEAMNAFKKNAKRVARSATKHKTPQEVYKCEDCGKWHLRGVDNRKKQRKAKG